MTILFCAKRRKTKKEEERRRRGERKREKFGCCCLFVLVLCCCVVLLSSSRYIIIIKNKIRVKNSLIKPNKLLILFKGEQDARRVLVLVLGFDLNIRFTFCFQK
jgi:hypothetical protein